MSPRSRGAKRVVSALASPNSLQHICSSCLQTLSRRSYASAAAAQSVSQDTAPPITQLSPLGPEASLAPQPTFAIKAGIVLSRPPLITPDPHPFETAYYLYQRRLNERLVLPFTQYFYYRRNTPAFEHWRKHRRERGGTAARDIGAYNAYTKEAWNDEVLVGDETGRPERIVEKLIAEEGRQAEFTGRGNAKYAGLRRTTEADEKGDLRNLERRLQRTLYLLVKTKGDGNGDEKWNWKFPSGPVVGYEGLKEAAQRILFTSLGPNMNTFFVGNHPVGHSILKFSSPRPSPSLPQRYIPGRAALPLSESTPATTEISSTSESQPLKQDLAATQSLIDGEKTFFMKARIMAGQAALPNTAAASESEENKTEDLPAGVAKGSARDKKGVVVAPDMGLEEIHDFRWLSKDEVESTVHPDYWRSVRNMLVAQ
ncbi:hypothetical protein G647_09274 [Cladophialophora carrionii CBS 160.54]|uniref:Large ribosomal subunit protein mL46 n=1 Tax=Cladophialophora carrionii CBS 160.54 TaxID=1279043 RepID=V9CXT0_9EURO|nr:uncharacterized protein G647_09274 [Cladophialophora carrionii CBS 160.54]ETI19440.1 hypothetical protein G647_09274 [Cladophialophora carrionii CBS 160.54]